MKALENLGRIGGVGLFSDKIEVNVTHRTVDDIERELAKTLEMYMGQAEEVKPEKPKSIGDIDINEELGTGKDESSTPPKG
jgi:hypothetical protein